MFVDDDALTIWAKPHIAVDLNAAVHLDAHRTVRA